MPKAPGDKRPPNAWILFLSSKRRELVIPFIPGESAQDRFTRTIRTVSAIWKATPEIEKKPWRTAAKEAKHRHLTLYPNYRFRPCRKGQPSSRAPSAVAALQGISSLQPAQISSEEIVPGWNLPLLSGNEFVQGSSFAYANYGGLHHQLVKSESFQEDLPADSEQLGESSFADWLQLDESFDASCGDHSATNYNDRFETDLLFQKTDDESPVRPRDSTENDQLNVNGIQMDNSFDDPGRGIYPNVQQYTYLNLI